MNNLIRLNFMKGRPPSSLLGLALDGSRLEGIVLRRNNGSLQVGQYFAATLSLDLLTNDAELVGREILNHLEAAGIRERRCVVAMPLKWALAAHTKIPDLPEADVPGFLDIEAERGFPTDVATLQVATSRLVSATKEQHATFVGVPRSHIERLEQALRAAKLKPVSFSLGITALQPARTDSSDGVLALVISDSQVALQVTCGGGVAALRALEGAVQAESGERALRGDFIAREARITLGQLPADLRDSVKRIRIFGPHDQALKLADEIRPRFEPGGLRVDIINTYQPGEFGKTIPADTAVSEAFSLAARQLVGRDDPFEFLPPKVSTVEQLLSKYASGKWRTAGLAAGGVLVIAIGLFAFQQWQLSRLRSQWNAMSGKVADLRDVQAQIDKYRPWFDPSFRYLATLRQLTTAFPDDGSLTAKNLQIRDYSEGRDEKQTRGISVVNCSGNAINYPAIKRAQDTLAAMHGVTELNVPTHGNAPIQFSLEYKSNSGGGL